MIENSIEGPEVRGDECEHGIAQQREIERGVGSAQPALILAPAGGIAAPVILVLHAPVAADDVSESPGGGLACVQTGDEEVRFVLSAAAFLVDGLFVKAQNLAGVGKLLIGTDGSYTFTPAEDYAGSVPSATYDVTDTIDTVTSTLAISSD